MDSRKLSMAASWETWACETKSCCLYIQFILTHQNYNHARVSAGGRGVGDRGMCYVWRAAEATQARHSDPLPHRIVLASSRTPNWRVSMFPFVGIRCWLRRMLQPLGLWRPYKKYIYIYYLLAKQKTQGWISYSRSISTQPACGSVGF